MSNINICNFPTQVIVVDDNESFLQSLELVISHNNNTYRSFSNPHEVEGYINQAVHDLDFLQKAISVDIDEYDLLSVNLHINNLYKEIYNPKRFKRISLFITDYEMPGINGLELCQKLKNTLVTRILLTGIADEYMAINAFNDGFIEQFMRKHDRTIVANLKVLITKFQEKYFERISNNYTNLFNHNQRSLDILGDDSFIQLFQNIINKENITEYYLLDPSGSFLMLTNKGEVSALYITTLEQHEAMISFARYENCPPAILKELESNNQTLRFYQNSQIESNLTNSGIDWLQYLIPLTSLNIHNGNIYYSYTNLVPFVDKEAIISFDAYKANYPSP